MGAVGLNASVSDILSDLWKTIPWPNTYAEPVQKALRSWVFLRAVGGGVRDNDAFRDEMLDEVNPQPSTLNPNPL